MNKLSFNSILPILNDKFNLINFSLTNLNIFAIDEFFSNNPANLILYGSIWIKILNLSFKFLYSIIIGIISSFLIKQSKRMFLLSLLLNVF